MSLFTKDCNDLAVSVTKRFYFVENKLTKDDDDETQNDHDHFHTDGSFIHLAKTVGHNACERYGVTDSNFQLFSDVLAVDIEAVLVAAARSRNSHRKVAPPNPRDLSHLHHDEMCVVIENPECEDIGRLQHLLRDMAEKSNDEPCLCVAIAYLFYRILKLKDEELSAETSRAIFKEHGLGEWLKTNCDNSPDKFMRMFFPLREWRSGKNIPGYISSSDNVWLAAGQASGQRSGSHPTVKYIAPRQHHPNNSFAAHATKVPKVSSLVPAQSPVTPPRPVEVPIPKREVDPPVRERETEKPVIVPVVPVGKEFTPIEEPIRVPPPPVVADTPMMSKDDAVEVLRFALVDPGYEATLFPEIITEDFLRFEELMGPLYKYFEGNRFKFLDAVFPGKYRRWEVYKLSRAHFADVRTIVVPVKWLMEEKLNLAIPQMSAQEIWDLEFRKKVTRQTFVQNNLSGIVLAYKNLETIFDIVYPGKFLPGSFPVKKQSDVDEG